MANPVEDQTPSALTYQTLVLKVYIHCEGCKKKVKKVLQSIDGVYMTTVDSQQHKVTVTGNVEAEVLVKRLLKAGKHAAIWPEEAKKNKVEKKEGDLADGGEKSLKESDLKCDEDAKSNENAEAEKKSTESEQSVSVDKKGQSGVEPNAAGKDEGGNNGSKKKKKKGKKNDSDKIEGGDQIQKPNDPPHDPAASAPVKIPQTPPVELTFPNQQIYPSYLPMHYPPMAYTTSYNTAYSIPTASHYAPPPAPGGYLLLHPRNYPPQMLPDKICTQQDEYNSYYSSGCSIM